MNGMVLLRYVGGNIGLSNWYGPVTGTRYEFGGKKVTGYVYAKDATKMLALRRRTRPLFQREPVPAMVKSKPVALRPPTPVVVESKPAAAGLGTLEAALPDLYQLPPESELPKVELVADDLTIVRGVGQATADKLSSVGIKTVAALARANAEALEITLPGFATWRAERIIAAAQTMVGG